jgi:hypothetical protein
VEDYINGLPILALSRNNDVSYESIQSSIRILFFTLNSLLYGKIGLSGLRIQTEITINLSTNLNKKEHIRKWTDTAAFRKINIMGIRL